jgi:hypothetical protein
VLNDSTVRLLIMQALFTLFFNMRVVRANAHIKFYGLETPASGGPKPPRI